MSKEALQKTLEDIEKSDKKNIFILEEKRFDP